MSEHITRLAERLQQQVGESHNKPTVKQFEEMLTDALGAEHLTVEPDTDEPETETEDDVPEGFERLASGLFDLIASGLFDLIAGALAPADHHDEYMSLLTLAMKYSIHVTERAIEEGQLDIADDALTASKALFETLKTVHEAALDALEEDVQ